ncbi:hypothetical protein D6D20_08756 [Aureobasidium pullulans]|uniref:BTB domain-containing protein n=1 Tax=Aureobasidium pullulans TaxID=5580 RepID=A0A4S8YNT1_AURPU|nr:hypothetical protein D6D20_08756 [Aureobasidium pullulans]THZ95963.1 hypothetical protein D6C82_07374 [Aureobasidium pullulans]
MSTPPKERSAPSPSKGAVSKPDKWPSIEHYNGIVTVVVGSKKKSYSLHKGLLCFYSDYFRAAFNGSFKEATDGKIELMEVEPEVFDIFQVWLYSRRLQTSEDSFPSYTTLAQLWVFGDKHQIPLLQNEVMDGIFAKEAKLVFHTKLVNLAYEQTPVGSPLRKAVIEIVGHRMRLQENDGGALELSCQSDWSVESLIDLVRVLDKIRKENKVVYPTMPVRDKCFFHVHGKDEHC